MITINSRDPRPIYEQIKEQICRLILTGIMPEGEKLPSVRDLAGRLAINPNTIQRAYRELEAQGFIYSIGGKGSFVAALHEVDQSRRVEKLEQFRSAAMELLRLGTDKGQLIAMLDQLDKEAHHD